MSLVIALAGSKEAVIGGDRRAISFLGSSPRLEEELYSGKIKSDQELKARAKELKASLQVSDGREKVWKQGELLVGEVTETSASLSRRRRIYLLPGAHLIVDITDLNARITGKGKVGCVVLGNRFSQALAAEEVARAGGRVSEALIKSILTKAGEMTASVSREHIILCSVALKPDPSAALLKALEEDCRQEGWRL
ncbi:Uncharacterised protein [uncultured archaeon]|nr:Uncharacterised protein [uncultured archaeon]